VAVRIKTPPELLLYPHGSNACGFLLLSRPAQKLKYYVCIFILKGEIIKKFEKFL
jgi:hypothetical protein